MISTKSFIAEYRGGRLDKDGACKDDYPTWASSYESPRRWQYLKQRYQNQFRIRKS